MRITYSLFRYFPAIGGVEEYVKSLAENAAKAGHNVEVLSSDMLDNSFRNRINFKQDTINNVEIKRFSAIPLKLRDYVVYPGMFLDLLKSDPELIHTHSYMYFCADSSAIAAKIKKIPFIVNPYIFSCEKGSSIGRMYRRSLGKNLMSADAVIAISEFEKKLILEYKYNIKRIEIVNPGINLEDFSKNSDENILSEFYLQESIIILCVCRIAKSKSLEVLIKALPKLISQYPELKLVIAGPDFNYKKILLALIKNFDVEKNVVFTDFLPRHKLISLYKASDLFVFPSSFEAFGIVMIEAMAAGLPIIAANACAAPEIVKNNVNGLLFQPENDKDLADKIIKILKDKQLKKEMAVASLDLAKKYDFNRTTSQMLDIYNSIVEKK